MYLLFSLLQQTGFGQWIEEHVAVVLSAIVTIVSVIIWLVRLEGKVTKVNETTTDHACRLDEVEKEFVAHRSNTDLHVNHQYMKALERRLDNIEQTITRGFEKAASQLEKLHERLYGPRS